MFWQNAVEDSSSIGVLVQIAFLLIGGAIFWSLESSSSKQQEEAVNSTNVTISIINSFIGKILTFNQSIGLHVIQ